MDMVKYLLPLWDSWCVREPEELEDPVRFRKAAPTTHPLRLSMKRITGGFSYGPVVQQIERRVSTAHVASAILAGVANYSPHHKYGVEEQSK